MSIKNNIEMVKEELTSEEKFFEKSVITERFIKKYKSTLIGGFITIVVLISGNIFYESKLETTAIEANKSLAKLKMDSTDAKALDNLKLSSYPLYEAYKYSQAIALKDVEALKNLQDSKDKIIANVSAYEAASSNTDLESYILNQDAVYKDLAYIQSAILLMEEGSISKAHEKLHAISENSSLKAIATALLHYGVQ